MEITPDDRLDWRCAICGYTRGAHKALGRNCPLNRHTFTPFHPTNTFQPVEKGPMKQFECSVENTVVSGVASEMHDGNYWATASISGGLTYGFVMMLHGKTKTPKYKCTQAVRITPGKGQIMKDATPVEITALVLPLDKLFAHVIETLVEYSKDDANVNAEAKAGRVQTHAGANTKAPRKRRTAAK